MAEGNERTFTEGEAYALVADSVGRETAEAKNRIAELEAENTDLKNKIDVLTTEKASAVEAADQAKKDFEDFKAELETQKAQEELKSTRLAKLVEVAPKLEISDERTARIVAMTDDVFSEYVEALSEAAKATGGGGEQQTPAGDLPRQSAAFQPGGDHKPSGSITSLHRAKRAANA